LYRRQKRNVGWIGKEVAPFVTMHLNPSIVHRQAFGVHEVGEREECRLSVAVCTMYQKLAWPRNIVHLYGLIVIFPSSLRSLDFLGIC
jgi:hypothetical protein